VVSRLTLTRPTPRGSAPAVSKNAGLQGNSGRCP
jgi:hypothetical protein